MKKTFWVFLLMFFFSPTFSASVGSSLLPAFQVQHVGSSDHYSLSLQILIFMTVLGLLPSLVLMMTSFTRIVIVLSMIRQAIGMPQTPTNQVVIGLSLFLSLFVMGPVLNQAYDQGLKPYWERKINDRQAWDAIQKPFRKFMLKQTRKDDLLLFTNLAHHEPYQEASDVPMSILIPSFVTSELKTAFQIGFMIFLPFLVIDLVVASVLMAMGMMMLSPMIVSLPIKIMLFVLMDGWSLVLGTLAASFG